MAKVKAAMDEISKYVLVFIVMLILFCISMILTYSLPNGNIRKNVSESLGVAIKNDINPLFGENVQGAQLDEFTDLLILNTALNKGTSPNQSVLQRAFENSNYTDNYDQALALKESVADSQLYNNKGYTRYWHGIQVIIRPLLMMFKYEEIRYIFYLIMTFLLAYSSYLMYRNVSLYHAFSYIIALASICIFIVPSSIQYMGIFTISILGVIAVNILYMKGKQELYPYLFVIIGCCAAFFDLLTTPVISIGLPLLNIVMIDTKRGEKAGKIFKKIIQYSTIWAVSYGATFVSKWLIASLMLKRDAVTSAINQLFFRFNGYEDHPTSRIRANIHNIKYLAYNKVFVIFYVTIFLVWIVEFIKRGKKIKDIVRYLLLYFFIALYPYIWYFVLAGHSMTHGWFTHRAQVVSILAALAALIECIDIPKYKEISEGEIWKK